MRKFVMCGTMRSIKFQIENMKEKNPDQHQWEWHNYHFFFTGGSQTHVRKTSEIHSHTPLNKWNIYIYAVNTSVFATAWWFIRTSYVSKEAPFIQKENKEGRRSWVLKINTDTHAYIYMLYTVIVLPCGCQDRVLRLNDNTPLISWIFLIFVFFFSMKDISSGDC